MVQPVLCSAKRLILSVTHIVRRAFPSRKNEAGLHIEIADHEYVLGELALALRFNLVAKYLKVVRWPSGYGARLRYSLAWNPGRETCVGCEFSFLRM